MKQLKLLSRQRGLFGLFDDDEEQESSSTQTVDNTLDVNRTGSETTSRNDTQTQDSLSQSLDTSISNEQSEQSTQRLSNIFSSGTTEQFQTSELLSGEVRNALEGIVLELSNVSSAGATGINNIGEILLSRADGAAEALQSENDAILARAEFDGRRQIEALNANLSRSAGAGAASNSFVASATGEALTGLEVDLAGLGAELNVGARNIETQELTNAAQVLSTGSAARATDTSAIAQIANVLRGALQTTQLSGSNSQREVGDITEQLSAILSGSTETSGLDISSVFASLLGETETLRNETQNQRQQGTTNTDTSSSGTVSNSPLKVLSGFF